jgi:glycine C-acetyltransferase
VLNFCANNYLGLADHPDIIAAAKDALDTHGFGMASVRFICGTQDLHKQLERTIADFFGTEDTILYAACFDANGGLFEPLLGEHDAIISDALNHASIIDGVRLCKASATATPTATWPTWKRSCKQAEADGAAHHHDHHRRRVLDGRLHRAAGRDHRAGREVRRAGAHRRMPRHRLPRRHRPRLGRGEGRDGPIDIFTGTLGKAMGGALGGFTTAKKEVIELLRQRSRPYLFSNSLPPHVVAAGIKAFEMLSSAGELRERLRENTAYFRERMTAPASTSAPACTRSAR